MRRLLAATVAALLVASACGADDEGQTPTTASATTAVTTTDTTGAEQPTSTTRGDTATTAGSGGPVLVTVGLRAFASCDAILNYYIENALELVGPYGLDGGPSIWRGDSDDAMVEEAMAAAEADAAPATNASQSAPSFTGTNVQVAGVDEADLVKTDGFYIYSLLDERSRLRIVEVEGGVMNLQATLDVGFEPREMLLHEDTLLLVATEWRVGAVTRIAQVDISDRRSPEVVADLSMDGLYNGARLSDGVARVVITSNPVGIEWEHPQGSGLRAEQEAIEANRELVRNSTLGNWLPAYVQADLEGGAPEWGQLVDCSNVLAPGVFSGLNTLSILLFDLSAGITDWTTASVVAEGDTIYATPESVYVATSRWVNWGALSEDDVRSESRGYATLIHKFDTSGSSRPVYEASGEVEGFLLNQFSMDEHNGDLRVAATAGPSWWWTEDSESHVTVLRPVGDVLEEIGSVWGLGEGERIFSVRFMGPDAYVVTFRQVDPLYALDLSDPTNPEVLGELKIPGFSSYLHPVGEDRLLGVGQDASLEGRVEGLQVSLFDVSDPTDPIRVAQLPLPEDHDPDMYSWSPVENDHRAFLYFEDLAYVPYHSYWWEDDEDYHVLDAGVAVVEVRSGDLVLEALLRPLEDGPVREDDRLWNRAWRSVPQRVMVIDDWLYSVSSFGIGVHRTDNWERGTFLEYPER